MKLFILIGCFASLSSMANAQQNYAANLISKDLLPYASSVVRNEEVTIEVKDLDNALYHVKKVITVLNKNGDDYAHIAIFHDKSDVIKSVKGVVYDEQGNQIRKFSESNFEDENAGGSALFENVRVKHYLPSVTDYPYTIAYEYEEKSKQTLTFDEWLPNPGDGVAVEKSSFTFICKPDFNIKYTENNLAQQAKITSLQGLKTYSWQVSNLKAIKYEPLSPYYKVYASSVKVAPETFTYYGIKGSYTNWNELGRWISDKLMANRQALTYETIQHVKELTKDIASPKLKAKKIYEYMQDRTHYISVQVGVGSYQPFLASEVDKENYGDCKALVNYTQALLKAVDIDSYYCIVKSGGRYNVSLQNDFASMNQADHIILCVPFKNDTTWADCTSQTIPFGYLGDFTDNRTVLALTPAGGKLLHTPKYTAADNLESRKGSFAISNTGELSGMMTTVFKGVNYQDCDEIIKEAKTEQYKLEQKRYPINNMDIDQLEIKQDKSFDPSTTESIKLHARDYATVTDNKIYFLINPANRENHSPPPVRNRINNVYITRGYLDEDEVIYKIPEGYHLEKRALNVKLNKPFGTFTAIMVLNGNQLIYKRRFQLNDGTYDKNTYQEVVDFYESVVDADDYNVVLLKN
ncbi:DUF3857 domain-containing protein [Mucilaginibacter xinganensis]|uniref:DUF3857 domain-containing protein n=1 Tax=Mucilaginibacter xinganensis TaxID=1234841 RepID=A0A223NX67_9SPHI|nr:DUF3857 domain-containing protein [Mucilaginibacter xinganensis]ASU34455.1 hypothetical protein MuYL_2568 [Mucilaginibacter xinganensis]